MFRAVLSFLLCLCALAVGLLTVYLAADHRARGSTLDATQRWCEVYSRQNDLLRAEIRREEWLLLSGADGTGAEYGVDQNAEPGSALGSAQGVEH